MKKALLLSLTSLFLFSISSCKKDKVDPYNDPATNAPTVSVTELLVQVVDASNQAVPNAYVDVFGYSKQTDANGVVQFRNISIPTEHSCIIVEKSGYYHQYKVIHPSSGAVMSEVVQLKNTPSSGSIEASSGGTIAAENGGSVVFEKNSFVTSSGSEYNGTVTVNATYADPYDAENNAIIPNSFTGINKKSEEVFAENKGIIIVELTDGSGNEVRIADNKKAEIHIPISSTDINSAPKKVPLYYFHSGYGMWIEDGEAKKDGDEYVGEVSHFSFWMCPYVYDHHFITGQITCSGDQFPGATVQVYNQYGAMLGSVTTNVAGGFSGSIPETLTHTLEVLDPCGNSVFTQQIGPFTAATNLGAIEICTNGNVNYGIVQGNLVDCNAQAETNAYLRIQSDGMMRYLPANLSGAFNQAVIFCNGATEASFMGINQDDLTASNEVTLPISSNMDFGTLSVCSTPPEYAAFNLDGTDYYYTPNQNTIFQAYVDSGNQNSNELRVTVTPLMKFSISGFAPTVGTTTVGGSPLSFTFQTSGNDGATILNVHFTQFGTNTGDVIEGTIDDTDYVDSGSNTRSLSNCSFRFIY